MGLAGPVGADDADGDGIEEAVYYNGYRRPAPTSWGRRTMPAATAAATRAFARHLGLEHMAAHGVQGRGVLVDLRHHLGDEWRPVGRSALEGDRPAADGVVVEPGDVLLLHTGFATRILEWGRARSPADLHDVLLSRRHDDSLLEWIADSQISALVADNYAVEGLLGKDRDPSRHSFLPIHHLCLFRLGVPLGELVPARAGDLAREHDRDRFLLTAPPAAPSGDRGLAPGAGHDF